MLNIREIAGGSTFLFILRRVSLIVLLAMALSGCDDIKCWPICGSSSSGVAETTETTETTDTTVAVVASITVTYPSGGETIGGGTHRVTWTKSSSVGLVRIDVYNSEGTLERWLGDKLTETHIDWEVQESNGLYRIRVTSTTDSTVVDESDYFEIKSYN